MDNLLLSNLPVNELAFAIAEQLKPFLMAQQPKQEPLPPAEKYLTRKETAEKLNVSLPTLGEYTKRNLIKGYRFGVRVLYKQSEVETSLTKMNFGRACHA